MSAAEVKLLVDRAQLVARGEAPACVLAAINLANAVRLWK